MRKARFWTEDRLRLLAEMKAAGRSNAEIGAHFDRTGTAIRQQLCVMRSAGMVAPLPQGARGRGLVWTAADDAKLRALRAAKVRVADIAAELGRSLGATAHRLARLRDDGRFPRAASGRTGPKKINWATPAFRALWAREDITLARIAQSLGVSTRAVTSAARALGLPARKDPYLTRRKIDDARLRELWLAGLEAAQIGRALGVPRKAVLRRRYQLGLPRRTRDGGGHGGWSSVNLVTYQEDQLRRAMEGDRRAA